MLVGAVCALMLWATAASLLFLEAASTDGDPDPMRTPEALEPSVRGLAMLLLPICLLGGALAGVLLSSYFSSRADRAESASTHSERTSDGASSSPSSRV